MSGVILSEYFESARPGTYDMCVIVKAVIKSAGKGVRIIPDTEHIRYDAYNKKVYLTGCSSHMTQKKYNEMIDGFLRVLYGACRYAGDGTDIFMQRLCMLAKKREYDTCMGIIEEYMSDYRSSEKKDMAVNVLCAATVMVCELIFLIIMNIKFY